LFKSKIIVMCLSECLRGWWAGATINTKQYTLYSTHYTLHTTHWLCHIIIITILYVECDLHVHYIHA